MIRHLVSKNYYALLQSIHIELSDLQRGSCYKKLHLPTKQQQTATIYSLNISFLPTVIIKEILMMQYKLEPVNGASISCDTGIVLIEKALQQLTRLTNAMLSIFYKTHSTELVTVANHTQHLQFEVLHLQGDVNLSLTRPPSAPR